MIKLSRKSLNIIATSLILSACSKSPEQRANEKDSFVDCEAFIDSASESSIQPTLNIPISILHVDGHQMDDGISTDWLDIYYSCINNDSVININPKWQYIDAINSNKRIDLGHTIFEDYPESKIAAELLTLEAYILNDKDEPLVIDKLILKVDSSTVDTAPYIYICTMNGYAHSLGIFNESWTAETRIKLDYKILKKDETFDGKYNKVKHIVMPDSGFVRVNFLDDIESLGYNYDWRPLLKQAYYDLDDTISFVNKRWGLPVVYKESGLDPQKIYSPFEWRDTDMGFYEGFCRIFGRMTIEETKQSLEFCGILWLSKNLGLGDGMDFNDAFDVELKEAGYNYVIEKPYITTIPPNSAERISLRITCPKSSYHRFKIQAINDNGINIQTLPIIFHCLMPRHSDQVIYYNKD